MATGANQPVAASDPAGGSVPGDASVASLAIFRDPEDLGDQNSFLAKCLSAGTNRRLELLQRIFSRCTWDGDCLIWSGPHSGTGRGGDYGRFSFEGVTASVHIAVYELVFGPVPPKKQLDHSCERRRCCNPFHLVAMTHKRNQKLRDKRRKCRKENDTTTSSTQRPQVT